MEITLVNPPSPFLADPLVMPPLGLLYIASSLEKRGVVVYFEDLVTGIRPVRMCGFYGVSATSSQFSDAVKILRLIKTANPEARVCIGGPHATLCSDACLDVGFDAVVVGEGEFAIWKFLLGAVGVVSAPMVGDLDILPFPDRSLVDDYHYEIDGVRAATVMTSRGCPYSCAFCCKTWMGVRYRSRGNVAEELRVIADLGFGGVMFYDDEMLVRRERDMGIFDDLASLGLVWRCFTRADLIDAPTAEFMADRGCREILIGAESGSDTILGNINKGVTVAQIKRAAEAVSDAGIRVKAAFIIGLPGESEDTLRETWRLCEEIEDRVSGWDFSLLVPYPGSPIYDHPERFDISFDRGEFHVPYKGGKWESVVSTSHLTKNDITEWRERIHRRFKGEVF